MLRTKWIATASHLRKENVTHTNTHMQEKQLDFADFSYTGTEIPLGYYQTVQHN